MFSMRVMFFAFFYFPIYIFLERGTPGAFPSIGGHHGVPKGMER